MSEPLELVVEDDLVVVFDGRVLEIFRSIEGAESPSVRFLVSRLEIREGEHKGRSLLRLNHRGKYDGRSGLSFPPEQAEGARRLVDALVAAGATRV
ncbi:MAG: hypothetical protein ACT4PI_07695 [Actinomycetota bacterium]